MTIVALGLGFGYLDFRRVSDYLIFLFILLNCSSVSLSSSILRGRLWVFYWEKVKLANKIKSIKEEIANLEERLSNIRRNL